MGSPCTSNFLPLQLLHLLDMDTQESSLSPIPSEQQLPNVAEVVGSPVLFSHQLASQFELGDMGRAELSEVAKVSSLLFTTVLANYSSMGFSVLVVNFLQQWSWLTCTAWPHSSKLMKTNKHSNVRLPISH